MEVQRKKVKKDQHVSVESTSPRSDSQINSPHSAQNAEATLNKPKQTSTLRRYVNNVAILIVVCISAYYGYRYVIDPDLIVKQFTMDQYRFQVFCPINKVQNIDLNIDFKTSVEHQELRVLTQQLLNNTSDNLDGIDKYLIYVKMMNISTEPNSTYFFYCSYVTDWINRNCSQAMPVCTLPGPIFYVEKDKPIDVAWVYNFNYSITNGFAFQTVNAGGCYNDSSSHHCTIVNKKKGKQACTYLDPTNHLPSNTLIQNYTLTQKSIAIDVHIHGLEVRPTFDGNPLSWLGVDGTIGAGYQSLLNATYFSYFKNPMKTLLQVSPEVGHIYTKVNRYQNFQPPGNLWYHDHTMHITKTNVALGMAGDYIIYDRRVNEQLPGPEYEVLIVAGELFNNTNNSKGHKFRIHRQKSVHGAGGIRNDPSDVPFFTKTNLTFERNQTYRIRVLNGQWDSIFTNLQFKTQCNEKLVHNQNEFMDSCGKILNFSIIGADSSIFDKPVHNVNQMTLASAERFQILIIFDGSFPDGRTENSINSEAESILLISNLPKNKILRNIFKLKPNPIQNINQFNKFPSQVNNIEGLTFYDLTQINTVCNSAEKIVNTTMCISTKRMRPMFRDQDSSFNFFFNGHYDFSTSGGSENPKIGTTQDWYLINTMINVAHPIHIHLINFQIIGKTKLRFFKAEDKNCSYYQIDFYRSAKKLNYTEMSDYQICLEIRNKLNLADPIYSNALKDHYREDEIDPKTLISGQDVLKPRTSNDSRFVNETNCDKDDKVYQYICSQLSANQIPQEYRRWKQVVLLNFGQVLHIRIRWTSTDYNTTENTKPYPYFSVPQDQLIEYPGYVYHCHFLSHEDNELMRPIMMKASDYFVKEYNVTGTPLGDCMKKKKLDNKDGWAARYQCINELSGCSVA